MKYVKIESIMEVNNDESYMDYNKELDSEAKRADEATSLIHRVLRSSGDATIPSTSIAPTGIRECKVKPKNSLELHKLMREHNSVELKSWCKKFKTWYTSSQMDTASVQEQQA